MCRVKRSWVHGDLTWRLNDINGSIRGWFPDAESDDVEHFSCIYLDLQEKGRVNTSLGDCDTEKCWGFCECAEVVSSSAFLTLCIFPFRRNPQETSVICSGLISREKKKQKHGGVLQKKTFWSSKWPKQPHNERCGGAMLYIWVSQRSICALPLYGCLQPLSRSWISRQLISPLTVIKVFMTSAGGE